VQFGDLALGDGHDAHASELRLLVEPGNMFLVAAQVY
jgi:hypothetical protein